MSDKPDMVYVPRTPTKEMVAAGFEAIRMEDNWPVLLARVYTAMIDVAASPKRRAADFYPSQFVADRRKR